MTQPQEITVYWRPGCGFCSRLLKRLDAGAIPHRRINIWEDAAAAARVRSITGGNETVPTVTVGRVSMVNPRIDDIVRLIAPAGRPEQHLGRQANQTSSRSPGRGREGWLRAFGATGWCSSLFPASQSKDEPTKMHP